MVRVRCLYSSGVMAPTFTYQRSVCSTATRLPAVARRTQQERSETTTSELLAAARDLFAERGYAATSLGDITAAAAVTKGALYHHFSGKRDVFEAVCRLEQRRLTELQT